MPEVVPPAGKLENPFDVTLSPAPLAGRLVCGALCLAAVVTGSTLLVWLSLPVLLWTLLVVWGRRALFLDNLHGLPHLRPGPASGLLPHVTVIVPVRNEEVGIEAAARSLAGLEYPSFEVLVIDDHSTDSTPSLLRQVSAEFPSVRVIAAPELPAGWAGKPHASWFGYQQANPAAEWLLFTDARVVYHPQALRQVVTHAEARGLDFLSCLFRFDGEGAAEGLVAATQSRALLTSARTFGGGDPKVPFALGAFTLIRRGVYAECGGHAVFRDHPIEDFMLVWLVKQRGGKVAVALAAELLWLRRYHGFQDMWRRIPRSLRAGASDRVLNLLDRAVMEWLLYASPIGLAAAAVARMAVWHRWPPVWLAYAALGFLTYLAGVASLRSCAAVSRFRPVVAWLHPLGGWLWIWFCWTAIGQSLRGGGLIWRDRALQAPAPRKSKSDNQ